jgi:hypothetical protein
MKWIKKYQLIGMEKITPYVITTIMCRCITTHTCKVTHDKLNPWNVNNWYLITSEIPNSFKSLPNNCSFGQSLRQCGIVSSMPRLYVLHDAYSPIWASYVPIGRPLLNINDVKTTTFLGHEWCYNLPISLLHCCSLH